MISINYIEINIDGIEFANSVYSTNAGMSGNEGGGSPQTLWMTNTMRKIAANLKISSLLFVGRSIIQIGQFTSMTPEKEYNCTLVSTAAVVKHALNNIIKVKIYNLSH